MAVDKFKHNSMAVDKLDGSSLISPLELISMLEREIDTGDTGEIQKGDTGEDGDSPERVKHTGEDGDSLEKEVHTGEGGA